MTLDWLTVEEQLYALTVETLREFAAEHSEEVSYGFAFQTQALFGAVRFALNTEEALQALAHADYPYYSRQEIDDQLRWDLDRWAYQGFNLHWPEHEDRWDERWWPIQDQIQEHILQEEERGEADGRMPPTAAAFLTTLGRVLLRIETGGAFPLRRSAAFRILLRDDREPLAQSWERLTRLRQQE